MSNDYFESKEVSKGFMSDLLDLAERALDVDCDTIDFTLVEKDGIRLDVTISFNYKSIDKEEN